jgi:hypothetical protein
MKNLIKFAVAAAIAGVLVNRLMKQRAAARFHAPGGNEALGGDEMVEAIEVVTLGGDMVGGDAGGDQPDVPRDEWFEIPTVDAPKH